MKHKHNVKICEFILLVWMLLTAVLSAPIMADNVTDYYDRELVNDFEVLDAVKGKVELNPITIPLPDGGSMKCLEVTAKDEAFTGKVGISIPLPELPYWWQFAHWWEIEIEAVWTPTRAMSDFVLECIDQNGESIERVKLIERPSPNILGTPYPDIPEITGAMIPKKYHFPLVAVPKARTADPSRKAARANLVLWFTDWFGTARVGRVKIRPFKLTPEMQLQWKPEGKTVFGGLPWFEPAYLSSGTAISGVESVIHETLRDTGHKLLAAVGMTSMRYFGLWEDLEPVKGKFDFEGIDHLIDELDYYGMKIGVMTVHGVAEWAFSKTLEEVPDALAARKATWKIVYPPDDWDDYEDFVKALVKHFKGRIKAWEVWNEPNSHVWGVLSPYRKYEQFLIRFYTEAKNIDPDCYVICGRVGWWIHNMLRDGMADYMDAVSLHPYPGSHGGNVENVMRQFREVQMSLIAADKIMPIEVTEFGLGASFPWTGPGAQDGERAKAEALTDILTAMKEATPSIYWYTPIQGNRQYGIVQFESDRYRPVDAYWAFGRVSGELTEEKKAVEASVEIPDEQLIPGREIRVKLTAKNTSDRPQTIRFWPVGFVDSLGFDSLEQVRRHDWQGVLNPGQVHETVVTVVPHEKAYGRYPAGLVVINESGNSAALRDLWIQSIASEASASASSCDMGSVDALNDLLIPVWSGDEDVPALIWAAKPEGRTEWIELAFDNETTISQAQVFWFADPKPEYPLRGRQSIYSDKIVELKEKYKIDAHGMEAANPAEDIKVNIEGYDNFSVPVEWQLMYRAQNGKWLPVRNSGSYPTEANRFNLIDFEAVRTQAVRLMVKLRADKGGGVHEIRIK